MLLFSDAHCHLQNATNPDMAINQARAHGVGKIVCAATHPDDWHSVCNIVSQHHDIHGTVGIHPWHATNIVPMWRDKMIQILIQNPKLQIGEIGLDKYHPNMDTQIDIMCAQMKIAADLKRGVWIHCVGAWDKILKILKDQRNNRPPYTVFHKFNGDVGIIERLINEYNAYFSFANNPKPQTIAAIPIERILTESDSDTPTDVVQNAQNIANILNMDLNQLTSIVNNNLTKVLI